MYNKIGKIFLLDRVWKPIKILLIILGIIPEVKSAIDVGCGVGTWLSVLKKMGVKKICGMDGNWVSKEYLVIPKDSFFYTRFRKI